MWARPKDQLGPAIALGSSAPHNSSNPSNIGIGIRPFGITYSFLFKKVTSVLGQRVHYLKICKNAAQSRWCKNKYSRSHFHGKLILEDMWHWGIMIFWGSRMSVMRIHCSSRRKKLPRLSREMNVGCYGRVTNWKITLWQESLVGSTLGQACHGTYRDDSFSVFWGWWS